MSYLYKIERPARQSHDQDQPVRRTHQPKVSWPTVWLLSLPLPLAVFIYLLMR